MFGQFGIWELILILAILLIIFGPSRIGDIGSSLGKGIRGFRKSIKDDDAKAESAENNISEEKAPGTEAKEQATEEKPAPEDKTSDEEVPDAEGKS